MAAPARKAIRGGVRRPFAPVAVPPSMAGNQVAREDAVDAAGAEAAFRGGGGKAKAAMKCGGASSPVPTSVSKRLVESAAAKVIAKAKPAYDAPAWDSSEEPDGEARTTLSPPSDEADQRRREPRGGEASSRKRTTWSVAMEEAMADLPEPGEGRVKYLVDTFERLLSLAGGGPENRSIGARRRRRRKNEAAATQIDVLYPSVASSSEVSFPAIAGVDCILDASDRTSMIKAARDQRRQRRCNSTGSLERGWSMKVTSQRSFNLRTEQRGKAKEENFVQRMRKMQMEEERLRNPLAQGLPYTTDEPEIPAKPPMKEPTEPIDLVLHSDARAIGRAKFDHKIAERNSLLEEVKLARERRQKVDEEIEIKQLRKEQVPKAHPMPDFTRPFVPKRSVRPQTIPREPRFQPRLMRHVSEA